MVMMGLRFDLRNPAFAGVSPSERLQAAIDMASWADERGCVVVSISEHHGSEDGYLPAPLVFAAALAARTQNLRIGIAALLAPFYDPLRLAEDVAILDGIAGGRIDIILGAGYVPDEVTMFGLRGRDRGSLVEQAVHTLRAAWTGEPFDYQGRRVRVTPRPTQVGGPRIVLGGSSEMAARRAARIGDGFVPVDGSAWEAYRDELARQNKPDPGPHYDNPVVVTFLAEDPEAMWPELLPYFLHETNAYGDWLDSAGLTGPYERMTGEQLRASGRYRVVTPDAFAGELAGMDHPFAFLNPMVGGVPPVLAWECLRLFDEKVRPALNA
jgi:alkanesulfonate monooxygenase SsuD/methylene tetrahydromethanopterin reductase-like flavin-dependent oxidoreductase (luciferase family)